MVSPSTILIATAVLALCACAKLWTARYPGTHRNPLQYSDLSVWQDTAGPIRLL